MYFWKIESLKNELKDQTVSERDYFLYFLLPAVLFYVAFEWSFWDTAEGLNGWDKISSISSILMVIFGSIACYFANGGNEGEDFLKKYISISFVMTIRLIFWMLLLFIPLYLYYYYVYTEESDLASTAVDTIPFLLLEAWYFWRIFIHVQDVRHT